MSCLREGDVGATPRSLLQPGRGFWSGRARLLLPGQPCFAEVPWQWKHPAFYFPSPSPLPSASGALQSLIEIVKRPVTALASLPRDQSRPWAAALANNAPLGPARASTEGLGLPGEARGRAPLARDLILGRGNSSWSWTVLGEVWVSPCLDAGSRGRGWGDARVMLKEGVPL